MAVAGPVGTALASRPLPNDKGIRRRHGGGQATGRMGKEVLLGGGLFPAELRCRLSGLKLVSEVFEMRRDEVGPVAVFFFRESVDGRDEILRKADRNLRFSGGATVW